MATSGSTNDYRVRLIELADSLAKADLPNHAVSGLSGNGDLYLKRFRAAYQHLASTVEATPSHRISEEDLPIA